LVSEHLLPGRAIKAPYISTEDITLGVSIHGNRCNTKQRMRHSAGNW
jgi:hypothetical protein